MSKGNVSQWKEEIFSIGKGNIHGEGEMFPIGKGKGLPLGSGNVSQ
jgi:hypothetical protein